MTKQQEAAVERLDGDWGGHDYLLDDLWPRGDGQPPAIEGWFGKSDVMGTLIPAIFCHIEPDGSVHT